MNHDFAFIFNSWDLKTSIYVALSSTKRHFRSFLFLELLAALKLPKFNVFSLLLFVRLVLSTKMPFGPTVNLN